MEILIILSRTVTSHSFFLFGKARLGTAVATLSYEKDVAASVPRGAMGNVLRVTIKD